MNEKHHDSKGPYVGEIRQEKSAEARYAAIKEEVGKLIDRKPTAMLCFFEFGGDKPEEAQIGIAALGSVVDVLALHEASTFMVMNYVQAREAARKPPEGTIN